MWHEVGGALRKPSADAGEVGEEPKSIRALLKLAGSNSGLSHNLPVTDVTSISF